MPRPFAPFLWSLSQKFRKLSGKFGEIKTKFIMFPVSFSIPVITDSMPGMEVTGNSTLYRKKHASLERFII
jgi:hypothetical protein